jgi:alpha-L-fucosidase
MKTNLKSLLVIGLTAIVLVSCGEKKPARTEPKVFTPSFTSDLESFRAYSYPEWFRDAKFGIWAHWGPQAVPRQGDWYARNMYQSESIDRRTKKTTPGKVYQYHVEHYGHPSKFGYKDIIPLWKAERWDPEKLMSLYKKVGAKYFVSMASHHDNFFLWDSKIHRWNAVQMGPKKDVVGLWQAAAKKEGLRFGVSEHLGASYTWFQGSHGADKTGPMKGIPYDGANPEYQDLYHKATAPDDRGWLTTDSANQQEWLASIEELIDMYHPDLLYSDSELPFGQVGRTMLAHYYNQDITKNNGLLDAVYTCKQLASEGRWVKDIERGAMDTISADPWQTDTSIGDWYYRTGQKYMTGNEVIQMLVDIVSKNGNLLLNVVQTPEGDLEQDVMDILDVIAAWTPVNGEGIYSTRPWKIYGEGPSTVKQAKGVFGGVRDVRPYTSEDIRFTTKDNVLYAFVMDTPTADIKIASLAKNSNVNDMKIKKISILGSEEKVKWTQLDDALVITLPAKLPDWKVIAFRIELKK